MRASIALLLQNRDLFFVAILEIIVAEHGLGIFVLQDPSLQMNGLYSII